MNRRRWPWIVAAAVVALILLGATVPPDGLRAEVERLRTEQARLQVETAWLTSEVRRLSRLTRLTACRTRRWEDGSQAHIDPEAMTPECRRFVGLYVGRQRLAEDAR